MIHALNRDVTELIRRVELPALKQKAKEFSVVTGLALVAFASQQLASSSPIAFGIAFGAVCLISIKTLPMAIHSGRIAVIKAALTSYFISFNCLAIGGLSAFLVHQTAAMFKHFLQTCHLGSFLSSMFILTAVAGHLFPICIHSLHKLFSILKQSQWESSIEQMRKEFKDVSNGVTMGARQVWESISAFIYLLASREVFELIIKFSVTTGIPLSRQGFLLNGFFTSLNFQQFINEIKEFSSNLEISESNKLLIYGLIKSKMRLISENSTESEINFLLDQAKWLVPYWMSPIEFVNLFHGRFLVNINKRISLNINTWEKIVLLKELQETLILKFDQFSHRPDVIISSENVVDELEELTKNFNHLKQQIEILQFEKRRLKIYSEIYSSAYPSLKAEVLPDENSLALSELQKSCNALSRQIEDLNSRYNAKKIDSVGPVKFLGANKCAFKYEDYLILKGLFGLDQLDEEEIDENLKKIGLASEEDFYTHKIMPRSSIITKAQLHKNLRLFIKGKEESVAQAVVMNQPPAPLVEMQKEKKYLKKLSLKISQLVYEMTTKGLILVPCLIYPMPAFIGLGLGSLYFSFRKFGLFDEFAGFITKLKYKYDHVLISSYLVQRRRLLSTTQIIQQNTQEFCHGNVFTKIALINKEILATIIINEFCGLSLFLKEFSIIGPFVQGVVLSEEIVKHFSALS